VVRDSGFEDRSPGTEGRIRPDRIPNPEARIPSLCAIVDTGAAAQAGWTPIDVARAFLAGGARFLQLRAKQLAGAAFLDTASAIVELARPYGGIVIVNDRADIARLAGAAGVHVGQEDLPPRDVRTVVGYDAVVGLSTHTVEQLQRALDEPVNYVAIGPVFGTVTKDTGYEAIGLERVADASRLAAERGVPLVAIGGITLDRAASVISAGAASVAIIGGLLATGDPESQTRAFLNRIKPLKRT
jgi:thiamine-phosphate pyrophosphorylase